VGYIVADRLLIERARHLRRLILRHTPNNNQRTLALFIAHGHYERLLRRHRESLQMRAAVLAQALRQYLPAWSFTEPAGGSALWVKAPKGTDMAAIELAARKKGVLIESGGAFFHNAEPAKEFARLAYSTIPVELIEPGIRVLAQVVRRQGRA
jgi:GntR family transcriptional regulator/MocR family aminotransferase